MNAAKEKGTKFETLMVNWLRTRLGDDRIERRTLNGKNDRGDVTGLRTPGGERVVAELKSHNRHELGVWLQEAQVEAGNDDARVGLVIFKRRGTTKPEEQYVLMDAEALAFFLEGGVR